MIVYPDSEKDRRAKEDSQIARLFLVRGMTVSSKEQRNRRNKKNRKKSWFVEEGGKSHFNMLRWCFLQAMQVAQRAGLEVWKFRLEVRIQSLSDLKW